VQADEHESATADVACGRVDDGEGESRCDGSVDSVAAFSHDFDSRVGGEVVNADDHGVLGAGRLLFGVVDRGAISAKGCGG